MKRFIYASSNDYNKMLRLGTRIRNMKSSDDVRKEYNRLMNMIDISLLISDFIENKNTPTEVLEEIYEEVAQYDSPNDKYLPFLVSHINFDYTEYEEDIIDFIQSLDAKRSDHMIERILENAANLSNGQIKRLISMDSSQYWAHRAVIRNKNIPNELVQGIYDNAEEGSDLRYHAKNRLSSSPKSYDNAGQGRAVTVSNVTNYLIAHKSEDSDVTTKEIKQLAQLITQILKQEESENGEKYRSLEDANIDGLIVNSDGDDPIYQIGNRLLYGEDEE